MEQQGVTTGGPELCSLLLAELVLDEQHSQLPPPPATQGDACMRLIAARTSWEQTSPLTASQGGGGGGGGGVRETSPQRTFIVPEFDATPSLTIEKSKELFRSLREEVLRLAKSLPHNKLVMHVYRDVLEKRQGAFDVRALVNKSLHDFGAQDCRQIPRLPRVDICAIGAEQFVDEAVSQGVSPVTLLLKQLEYLERNRPSLKRHQLLSAFEAMVALNSGRVPCLLFYHLRKGHFDEAKKAIQDFPHQCFLREYGGYSALHLLCGEPAVIYNEPNMACEFTDEQREELVGAVLSTNPAAASYMNHAFTPTSWAEDGMFPLYAELKRPAGANPAIVQKLCNAWPNVFDPDAYDASFALWGRSGFPGYDGNTLGALQAAVARFQAPNENQTLLVELLAEEKQRWESGSGSCEEAVAPKLPVRHAYKEDDTLRLEALDATNFRRSFTVQPDVSAHAQQQHQQPIMLLFGYPPVISNKFDPRFSSLRVEEMEELIALTKVWQLYSYEDFVKFQVPGNDSYKASSAHKAFVKYYELKEFDAEFVATDGEDAVDAADIVTSPTKMAADKLVTQERPDEQKNAGLLGEKLLEACLTRAGVDKALYLKESEQTPEQHKRTPDILFRQPIIINGAEVNWIDAKSTWIIPGVSNKGEATHLIKQIWNTREQFGPGLVCWTHGFFETTELLIPEGVYQVVAREGGGHGQQIRTERSEAVNSSACYRRWQGKGVQRLEDLNVDDFIMAVGEEATNSSDDRYSPEGTGSCGGRGRGGGGRGGGRGGRGRGGGGGRSHDSGSSNGRGSAKKAEKEATGNNNGRRGGGGGSDRGGGNEHSGRGGRRGGSGGASGGRRSGRKDND